MKPLAFAADAVGLDYVSCMGLGRARIALTRRVVSAPAQRMAD